MKRLLFPLISAITFSTAVHAEISDELNKKCSEARDTFKVLNKEYLHEEDMKRQLEFFFTKNLMEIFPENKLSTNQKQGTLI